MANYLKIDSVNRNSGTASDFQITLPRAISRGQTYELSYAHIPMTQYNITAKNKDALLGLDSNGVFFSHSTGNIHRRMEPVSKFNMYFEKLWKNHQRKWCIAGVESMTKKHIEGVKSIFKFNHVRHCCPILKNGLVRGRRILATTEAQSPLVKFNDVQQCFPV
jgi:hypothetical protein